MTPIATLTIHGADSLSPTLRKQLIGWLASNSKTLKRNKLAKRFTARFIV